MKTSFAIAASAAFVLWMGSAQADVLSLNASAHVGGSSGTGIAGAQQDDAFHAGAEGAAYGGSLGIEFLLLDGWIEHSQYRNSDGLAGTWTQFMLGLDADIGIGEPRHTAPVGQKPKKGSKAYHPGFIDLGLAFGFGVGTGQQIDPPLDYTELTDRGFFVQASAHVAYRFNRVISLGVKVPVQYGYMFKMGVANDESTHYQSLHGAALLNLQMKFVLK